MSTTNTELVATVELKICKVSGVSKTSGKPFTMVSFKYFDDALKKEIFLQPTQDFDRIKLDLIYAQGWLPNT